MKEAIAWAGPIGMNRHEEIHEVFTDPGNKPFNTDNVSDSYRGLKAHPRESKEILAHRRESALKGSGAF